MPRLSGRGGEVERAGTRGRDPLREKLDAEILAWMRDPDALRGWRPDDARFERLALELFAFQFERCAPYRRFCERRGRTPGAVNGWREIPAVPTGAFKELALRSFPAERTVATFRTSGTSTASRGELHLDTLELYEASLLPTFERFVLPGLADGTAAPELRVLAPSPREQPDSSLSHMFGVVLRECAAESSGFDLTRGALALGRLLARIERAERDGDALVLCGTAFSFAHLLEALEARGRHFALPPGSRVMETGGFKGRARPLPRAELYAAIGCALGIPEPRIVNQYGMTELGSQFYDSVLRHPDEPRRKLGPPWARVCIVDPESGAPAPPGAVGALAVVDLANTGSVAAILTADLGREVGDGFEVIGREPGAETRGCSLAAEELLAGSEC